jgi:hypothetical protein
MRLLLYQDSTLSLDLIAICAGINRLNTLVSCECGAAPFHVAAPRIEYPDTYASLAPSLLQEAGGADLSVCCTELPYDNNFFFEYSGRVCILSFSGWSLLTSLPIENGLVYFLATFLAGRLFHRSHERTTGCISDFLGNKRAIDIGMRSAYVCTSCSGAFESGSPSALERSLFAAVQQVLNEVSQASRSNESIVEYWKRATIRAGFDVFLCHNSTDKEEVRGICRDLRSRGLQPWLDDEQLRPGLPWQEVLEEQIGAIAAVAVFVGASGFGPWQNRELRSFLDEFVRRHCPVIPVLLPSSVSPPDLPLFLRQMTWVDYRRDPKPALELLIWGITGERPRHLGSAGSFQAGER